MPERKNSFFQEVFPQFNSGKFNTTHALTLDYVGVSESMHYGEVAMGIWTQDYFIFKKEIYLEYLDTDKMRGKSI